MRVSNILAVGTLLAVAGAAYFYAAPHSANELLSAPDRPLFAVQPERLELPDAKVGKNIVRLVFTNTGRHRSAVILGAGYQCDNNCCYKPVSGTRVPVAPGASVPYECEITVREPGPFSADIQLFADEGVLRTFTIPVSGTATP